MASRNRAEKACHPCKIRKSKCSDFRPCARCSQTQPEWCWEASGKLHAKTHGEPPCLLVFDATLFDSACPPAYSDWGTADVENKKFSANLEYREPRESTDRFPAFYPFSSNPSDNSVSTTAAHSTTLIGSESFRKHSHHSVFSVTANKDTFLIEESMDSKQGFISAPEIDASACIVQHTSWRFGSIDCAAAPIEQPNNDGDGTSDPWVWEATAGPGRHDPFKEDWAAWAKPAADRDTAVQAGAGESAMMADSEQILVSEVELSPHVI